jgi:alkaline phosphatase
MIIKKQVMPIFIKVIFGGGRRKFLRNSDMDYFATNKKGDRVDGRNLIEEWNKKLEEKKLKHKFLWNKADFDALRPNQYDHILGSFH